MKQYVMIFCISCFFASQQRLHNRKLYHLLLYIFNKVNYCMYSRNFLFAVQIFFQIECFGQLKIPLAFYALSFSIILSRFDSTEMGL